MKQSGKVVPYGGTGQVRPDGNANYGFKNIKGHPNLIDEVPELQDDPHLRELVKAMNQPETGIFSVGCLSFPIDDDQGYRKSGYIEFAFNSDIIVADAINYFKLYFHFDRMLHDSNFEQPFHFAWELAGATFTQAGASGFTGTIFLNTAYNKDKNIVDTSRSESLFVLTEYLGTVPMPEGRKLY